jgi:hypothetical protein
MLLKERPGTVDELIEYGKSPHCGLSELECRACWDHYESVGWQVQGQPLGNWQARVRVWKSRQQNFKKNGKSEPISRPKPPKAADVEPLKL